MGRENGGRHLNDPLIVFVSSEVTVHLYPPHPPSTEGSGDEISSLKPPPDFGGRLEGGDAGGRLEGGERLRGEIESPTSFIFVNHMTDQIKDFGELSRAVRFADRMDLDGCITLDHPDMSAEIIQRKVEQREIIVAEKAGQLVGYLRLEYLWSLVPYIALIWVVEDQRRQGIGKALLHHLENVLREQGHTALYSSSQANEPEPQAWHRHAGFEECGFIAGISGGGIGEIFFRKDLSCLTQLIARKETPAP